MAFHWPERRTGFDRRAAPGAVRSWYVRTLGRYRDSSLAVTVVVLGFVALSAADLALTLRALEAGATELNPVMAVLFEAGAVAASGFKLSLAAAVAAVLWAGRRYRRILEVSLFAFGFMALLLGYHLSIGP